MGRTPGSFIFPKDVPCREPMETLHFVVSPFVITKYFIFITMIIKPFIVIIAIIHIYKNFGKNEHHAEINGNYEAINEDH